ncbi:glycoside hydrolase domain-containing protein [Terrimonas pollutisoli]|uniref:glycoside hydrolase domain-containing protein n=1 Tax=Terrimonas pollutisoli TaxID=3034147 RepID=UPI0023EC6419|nr:glycoside hydrolase domain-containing protein [Terrimonas sp. H1YJ31]
MSFGQFLNTGFFEAKRSAGVIISVIEARSNAKQNIYIQSVSFNKKKVDNCWIDRKKLTEGGVLLFDMGSQPNTAFGIDTPPPSMSTDK